MFKNIDQRVGNVSILTYVLEDQEAVLAVIDDLFKMNGLQNYKLFSRSSDLVEEMNDKVHICVVDYMLGEKMTGLEVMKIILSYNPRCKVVVISGQTDFEVVQKFWNGGAFRYINKRDRDWLSQLVTHVQEALIEVKKQLELISELRNNMDSIERQLNTNRHTITETASGHEQRANYYAT